MREIQRGTHSYAATPEQQLAAAVIDKAVSALWYGDMWPTYASRQAVSRQATYDIANGGLDFWLDALNLPVEDTIDMIFALMPLKIMADKAA